MGLEELIRGVSHDVVPGIDVTSAFERVRRSGTRLRRRRALVLASSWLGTIGIVLAAFFVAPNSTAGLVDPSSAGSRNLPDCGGLDIREGTAPRLSADGRVLSFSVHGRIVGNHVSLNDPAGFDGVRTIVVCVAGTDTPRYIMTGVTYGSVYEREAQRTGKRVPDRMHPDEYDVTSDGRFVAFDSYDETLVEGDLDGRKDVFLYDTLTNETRLISTRGDEDAYSPVVSDDGDRILIREGAPDRVPRFALYDVKGGTRRLLEPSELGQLGFGASEGNEALARVADPTDGEMVEAGPYGLDLVGVHKLRRVPQMLVRHRDLQQEKGIEIPRPDGGLNAGGGAWIAEDGTVALWYTWYEPVADGNTQIADVEGRFDLRNALWLYDFQDEVLKVVVPPTGNFVVDSALSRDGSVLAFIGTDPDPRAFKGILLMDVRNGAIAHVTWNVPFWYGRASSLGSLIAAILTALGVMAGQGLVHNPRRGDATKAYIPLLAIILGAVGWISVLDDNTYTGLAPMGAGVVLLLIAWPLPVAAIGRWLRPKTRVTPAD